MIIVPIVCSKCEGMGKYQSNKTYPWGKIATKGDKCSQCDGQGKIHVIVPEFGDSQQQEHSGSLRFRPC